MKNICSFFLTLTLTTIATTQLGAMEYQCIDVEVTTAKRKITPLLQAYTTLSNELPQEIVNYTVSYYRQVSPLVDDIVQNCDQPYNLVNAIGRLCKICCPDLSAEIVTIALYKTGRSLCDIKDRIGWTALHEAAFYGYTEVIKVVLASAKDKAWELICTKNNFGKIALHYAACYVNTEVCKVILATAEDKAWKLICKMKDLQGNTALHYAANHGHTKVVKVLLASAKDKAWELICMKNNNGRTTLHEAADYGHVEVINILLTTAPEIQQAWKLICTRNGDGFTVLNLANHEIKQIMEQYRPGNQ